MKPLRLHVAPSSAQVLQLADREAQFVADLRDNWRLAERCSERYGEFRCQRQKGHKGAHKLRDGRGVEVLWQDGRKAG